MFESGSRMSSHIMPYLSSPSKACTSLQDKSISLKLSPSLCAFKSAQPNTNTHIHSLPTWWLEFRRSVLFLSFPSSPARTWHLTVNLSNGLNTDSGHIQWKKKKMRPKKVCDCLSNVLDCMYYKYIFPTNGIGATPSQGRVRDCHFLIPAHQHLHRFLSACHTFVCTVHTSNSNVNVEDSVSTFW